MWTAILLVVMTSGIVYTDTARMDELGLDNTKAACEAFIAEADARFQKIQNPELDHYKLGCVYDEQQ